jgi:aminoglycoside phosphotransferase (APT) family kinase protein
MRGNKEFSPLSLRKQFYLKNTIMNNQNINKVCKIVFKKEPLKITKKTIGICNEVFEIEFENESYILRMNEEKKYLYGTHKFLPIFQKLQITTPKIIVDDYSKTQFPFCYQILNKIEGQDLGVVIHELNEINLKLIASEISTIFDKFKSLPLENTFGKITGLDEEKYYSLMETIDNQKKTILERNEKTKVIDQDTVNILNNIINNYQNYFLQVKPKLYYDDICSKNVMIHNGKFNGLVDLDFLMKGDYLEAIGRIIASWHGKKHEEIYINEIIKLQKLDENQQKIVKMYAILNLIYWTSEEGIQFNSNSSGVINWENVKNKKAQIVALYNEIKE